ncbi:uncharacterized protein LOC119098797 [Pollicipes pollicipes]|uniref:uncharacterized protein LOC119098797 n=1 Tax=Pollicipes pollicipes TaxID=41117 RepID=UPI001884BBA5|nr:uncharacterized protein LOC119098797 [Pollicipes pollicipes]
MPGSDSPKYSCACGLSQDEKKRKWFAGRCPVCHTKTKYPLRPQGSFDTATADRAGREGSPAELGHTGRSRSEERLHGCRLTDLPPPLYCRRPVQRQTSTECLDPAALSTSPPPSYHSVSSSHVLPSYDDVHGGRSRHAAQPTAAGATLAAAPVAESRGCEPSCGCGRAELEQRDFARLADQYQSIDEQICPCARCQERYRELYQQMNDDTALPMATPMLMQDVLTDGLAFCSLM